MGIAALSLPSPIVASRLHHVGGALSGSFANSQRTFLDREAVVLQLVDADGQTGVGEAAPLVGHSQECLSQCMSALHGVHKRITMDAEGWPVADGLSALPAARFALETAYLDLLARRHAVSIATLFQGLAQPIPRSAVAQSLTEAESAWQRGIRTIKVKVGDPKKEASDELHILSQLRSRLGKSLRLRLDANGAWPLEKARAQLSCYAEWEPDFVEQPVAVQELDRLGSCAVPWAADESLLHPVAAEKLLQSRDCAVFVLKPALLGFRCARQLALAAAACGKGVVITHSLDGPIGLAAACELALSLPSAPLPSGLDAHPGLSAFPAVAIPHHAESAAQIAPSRGPGLGFPVAGVPWT